MNRKQFAETVAQAYVDQYHWQTWRRNQVMNNPAVDYDMARETFRSCSTLTPTGSNEVRVLELSDGMFGSYEKTTKRDIISYLVDGASDDLWNDVVNQIADFRSEQSDGEA